MSCVYVYLGCSVETATIDYTDGDVAMTIADGGNVTTSGDLYISTYLKKTTNDITYEYESKNRSIKEVWAVLMREGDFHMLHNHQEVGGVSGGLYLKIPEVKQPQGNINWVSDNKVFSWSPKDGDYFVWPSHLIHGVYPFKGSGNRIMISWNSV